MNFNSFVNHRFLNQMPPGARQQIDTTEAGWELNWGAVETGRREPESRPQGEHSGGLVKLRR